MQRLAIQGVHLLRDRSYFLRDMSLRPADTSSQSVHHPRWEQVHGLGETDAKTLEAISLSFDKHFEELRPIYNACPSEGLTIRTLRIMVSIHKDLRREPHCDICFFHWAKKGFEQHIVEHILLFELAVRRASNNTPAGGHITQHGQGNHSSNPYVLLHECPALERNICFHNVAEMLDHIHRHHDDLFELWSYFNTEQHLQEMASEETAEQPWKPFMDLMSVQAIYRNHH